MDSPGPQAASAGFHGTTLCPYPSGALNSRSLAGPLNSRCRFATALIFLKPLALLETGLPRAEREGFG